MRARRLSRARDPRGVEIDDEPAATPDLSPATLTGGPDTYAACQMEARRLRAGGATRLVAPSAALVDGGASGWRVEGGLQPGAARQGRVIVLFGRRGDLVGWAATIAGRPADDILPKVRRFGRR